MKDDLTRLACLWSQQELCGRRLAKIDPFEWACHEPNVDSFLLFARFKRLPKVPTFAQAVMQQRQAIVDQARTATRDQRSRIGRSRDFGSIVANSHIRELLLPDGEFGLHCVIRKRP